MSKVGDAIEKAREKVAAKADRFLPGSCSIVKNTFVNGGSAGDTLTPSAGASGIAYKYKSAGHQSQIVVGGKAHSLSHWLTLPFNEDTLAINPEDRIQDDNNPELIFQDPVVISDSFAVFVKVAATVVQQGYQQ